MILVIISVVVVIAFLVLINLWSKTYETKYRICEITNGLGEKTYYPQYKKYLFWTTFKDQIVDDCFYSKVWFNSYNEAKNFIRKEEEKIKRNKIISIRNLTV